MIKRKENLKQEIRENLRGGRGKLLFTHVFDQGEVANSRMFAVTTIRPGDSIGIHPHENEGEAYLILEGSATVTEDGVDYILNPGDAEYCGHGHTHGILNHTDSPLTFLAVVIHN